MDIILNIIPNIGERMSESGAGGNSFFFFIFFCYVTSKDQHGHSIRRILKKKVLRIKPRTLYYPSVLLLSFMFLY